jgi:hypothetical protein
VNINRDDPLYRAWQNASHKDDWGVRVVYDSGFLKLVADELDCLADELAVKQREMRETDDRTIRSSGLGEGIRHLRARAAYLRGGAA